MEVIGHVSCPDCFTPGGDFAARLNIRFVGPQKVSGNFVEIKTLVPFCEI
jgi:hypothetical protein